jgi:hypothetical protein
MGPEKIKVQKTQARSYLKKRILVQSSVFAKWLRRDKCDGAEF